MRELLESLTGSREVNPDDHLFWLEKPAAQYFWDSLPKYSLICDLIPILIRAPVGHTLLTSDHPVVMTSFASLRGLVKQSAYYFDEAGLSIYYPLSSSLGLLLVDRHVYSWPKRKSPLKLSVQDVETLNLLQFQNCNKVIYGEGFNQEMLDLLNHKAAFLQQREVVTEQGNYQPPSNDLSPKPYTFQHHYQASPVRNLSILGFQKTPIFKRSRWIERDIRHNHPGPAANLYINEVASKPDTLWKFSEYITAELQKRDIVYPHRARKHPYEIL